MNGITIQAGVSPAVTTTPYAAELIEASFRRDRSWVQETHVRPMAGHLAVAAVALVGPASAAARAQQRFPVQIRSLRRS
ncbi:hypothetical protein [Gordonia insulae]|uniref:Uncharacterized protein n=1 Tax=Gordonia insulae TaxID=2420509 RepID=A0A3G8JU38_9ACTN|nr:hypothetical protein [Gordonia insulae]AZG48587.1 hypothetical protein D7316_05204 [Gordonia insulae]